VPQRSQRVTGAQLQSVEERNAEIVRRYQTGETLASIGSSRGLTRERVRQIVKLAGARMPRAYKCAVEECHTAPRLPRIYCHAHQVRFELFGDPLGSSPVVPLLPAEHGTRTRYREGGCRCDLCRKASADQRREHFHRAHPEWRYMPLKGRRLQSGWAAQDTSR
jgi:hypothetical protein